MSENGYIVFWNQTLHIYNILSLSIQKSLIPGPPFLLGSCTVVVAFLVALFIPEHTEPPVVTCADTKETSTLAGVHINTPLPGSDEDTPALTSDEDFEPLLQDSVV